MADSKWGFFELAILNFFLPHLNENKQPVYMRYHLFLHYGWFFQNLGKDFIRTNVHTTVHGTQWVKVFSEGVHILIFMRTLFHEIFTNGMLFRKLFWLMCGSCHIKNVLIGIKYGNCRRALDVYLSFFSLDGATSIKTELHICNLWTVQFVSSKSVIYFLIDLFQQNRKR